MLDHAIPPGLCSERIEEETGESLCNYPQTISHIGLLNSAIHLASARAASGELAHDPHVDVDLLALFRKGR